MKRYTRMIVVLLMLALLLSACTTTGQTPTEPVSDTTPPTTATESTAAPTEPMPTADPQEVEAYQQYSSAPFTYKVCCYKPTAEYDYPGKAFDRTNMVTDYFYGIDDGDVYLISDQPVLRWDITKEHVYYVTSTEPTKVYRTNLHGQEKTVVYSTENGSVTWVEFSGKDANGKLIIAEDQRRIVEYVLSSRTTKVLLEAYHIPYFTYSPYPEILGGDNSKGPAIWWRGRLNENDQEDFHLTYCE